MSKVLASTEKISLIADKIRELSGLTETLNLDEMAAALGEVIVGSGGVELPTLTSPANNDEVFLNKEYIDGAGAKQTGSFSIDEELTTQDDLIAQIQSAVDELPEAGNGSSGNSFPYKITVTTSGMNGAQTPVICYGDDNDTVLVATYSNGGGVYNTTWSCTNCVRRDHNIDLLNGVGSYAIFSNFTGDATISITWKLSQSGQ